MIPDFSLRRGEPEDSYAVFVLFEETLYDLMQHIDRNPEVRFDDPEKLARMWAVRRRLYEHLAHNADQFWIAEKDGEIVGFSRSVVHGGVRELSEFFVKPDAQSRGIGTALFEKAFTLGDGLRGSIIATLDVRAQSRYIKAGMEHRFLIMYFGKTPVAQPADGRLRAVRLEESDETYLLLNRIDRQVLGFNRTDTHEYLLNDRKAFAYVDGKGELAGYGYVGAVSGPFALLDPADYPQALAMAETEAAVQGLAHFGLEVPAVNQAAVKTLLARGFSIDPFMAVYMSSAPLTKPEQYILTSPPFVL